MRITGSRQLPKGYGAGTGPRQRRDKKGQNGLQSTTPASGFYLGRELKEMTRGRLIIRFQ